MHILIFINIFCLCTCMKFETPKILSQIKTSAISNIGKLGNVTDKFGNKNTKTNVKKSIGTDPSLQGVYMTEYDKLQLQEDNSDQIMDLLASNVPIKPSYIEEEEGEERNIAVDFNKNVVNPLRKYLLTTHKYIQCAINKHNIEPQLDIIDNLIQTIVLDDYKIGQLLQYYYHRSQSISKIFKICWFYIEINRIWDKYKNRKQSTIEDFKTMFENKIFFYVYKSEFNIYKFYESIKNPESDISVIKKNLYELSDSKINVEQNSCNWFTIKNLSMKPLMELNYIYNLYMTKVTYNDDELYLGEVYDNILSEMDVYSLFNYNHICKAVVLRQFNEWLINIFLTLSKFHQLELEGEKNAERIIKSFDLAFLVIMNCIRSFKMFFEQYFNFNIEKISTIYTNKMYKFMESKEYNNTIERFEKNKNYTCDQLVSLHYFYLAKNAFFMELNKSTNYTINIENEDNYRNNNRVFKEETLTDEKNKKDISNIYSRSITQIDTISKDKSVGALANDLINNVIHMNLMISVYKCLIAKQLNIDSRYYVYIGDKPLEFDNNSDYSDPKIFTPIFDQYLNGYVYLSGSKTENPPIHKEINLIICDANEILDGEVNINDTPETKDRNE